MGAPVATRKAWVALLVATLVAAMAALAMVVEARPAHAAFPGTPNAIAFNTNRAAGGGVGDFDIYRMGSDGFGQTRLVDSFAANDSLPAFSADGTMVAYHVDQQFIDDKARAEEILVTTSDNGAATSSFHPILSDNTSNETEPAWFPSGLKIAFRSDTSGGGDIYYKAIDADGLPTAAGPVRLTKNAVLDQQPAVSPDGTKIAFSSRRSGNGDIYVMKAAPESSTNVPKRLTTSTIFEGCPDWSPSGKQIVFQSGADGGLPEIHKMNSDGTNKTNLTQNGLIDRDPVFSPDGAKIAFERVINGNRDIWRMRADGSRAVALTNNAAADANPSWQPIP